MLQESFIGDRRETLPTPWVAGGPGFSIYLIHAYHGKITSGGINMKHPAPPLTAWQLTAGEGEVAVGDGAWQALPLGQWVLLPLVPRRQRLHETAHLRSLRWRFEGPLPEDFRNPIVCNAEESVRLTPPAERVIRLVERQFGQGVDRLRLPERLNEDSLTARIALARSLLQWAQAWSEVLQAHTGQFRPHHEVDPRIEDVYHRLHSAPLELRLEEATLARDAGLSRAHFKRLFQAAYGESAREVRERVRTRAATTLLRESDQPIKSVASTVGFASHAAFTQWFTRTVGLPPQQFRETLHYEA